MFARCLSAVLIAAMIPAAALSDTASDQDRCTAAYHAQDDQGMITWCKAAAEDHDVDAVHQSGEDHYQSLLMEGIDLIDLSMSEGLVGDEVTGHYVAQEARSIFEDILSGSHDQRILNTAADAIKHADGLIDLNRVPQ
jgi:hypothetical protein